MSNISLTEMSNVKLIIDGKVKCQTYHWQKGQVWNLSLTEKKKVSIVSLTETSSVKSITDRINNGRMNTRWTPEPHVLCDNHFDMVIWFGLFFFFWWPSGGRGPLGAAYKSLCINSIMEISVKSTSDTDNICQIHHG